MNTIGSIQKIYRYPVKSMAGEQLEAAFVGFSGLCGDRIAAFKSPAGLVGVYAAVLVEGVVKPGDIVSIED